MKIAVTGHRPDKLGGYEAFEKHRAIRRHMKNFLEGYIEYHQKQQDHSLELILISGGALGIDKFWIQTGLHLKLPIVAALPFQGYDSKWPHASREEYGKLLDKCSEVVYVSEPGYEADKLHLRNKWMVDRCDLLVAYWNGTSGGTANCVEYAKKQKRDFMVFDVDVIMNLQE
jgi:uncharacterized phage-like protein YoqJ